MHRSFIAAAMCLATSLVAVDAQQPIDRVQVGVLECRGGASVGFIVGSVTNLGCILRIEGVEEDRYIATIRKVGVDLAMGVGRGAQRSAGLHSSEQQDVQGAA